MGLSLKYEVDKYVRNVLLKDIWVVIIIKKLFL